MNRILEIDPDGGRARVQPGVINDQLRHAAQKYGLTFAPDPATHAYCTLGGNIGNNSCGAHTVMGGKTVDNVEELDILTYDGSRMQVGATDADALERLRGSGGRPAEIYTRLKQLADRYSGEIRRPLSEDPATCLRVQSRRSRAREGLSYRALASRVGGDLRVILPEERLCSGRPLYDYGMLDLARRKLLQAIDALRPAIRAGVPVVGLEPSCLSVFRDELRNMLADDEDAQRLARQSRTISELLLATPGWKAPQLKAKALVQSHCHQKAVLDADTQQQMFRAMGVELEPNPAGCCGQAGSFGYEADHYPVSMMTIAKQSLLPAIRSAGVGTLIVTDGFSCREQIRHGTGRDPLHPVEVLELALCHERIGSAREIERRLQQQPAAVQPAAAAVAFAAFAGIAGLALWFRTRRRFT